MASVVNVKIIKFVEVSIDVEKLRSNYVYGILEKYLNAVSDILSQFEDEDVVNFSSESGHIRDISKSIFADTDFKHYHRGRTVLDRKTKIQEAWNKFAEERRIIQTSQTTDIEINYGMFTGPAYSAIFILKDYGYEVCGCRGSGRYAKWYFGGCDLDDVKLMLLGKRKLNAKHAK